MAIDITAAKSEYRNRTAGASQKLVDRFKAAPNKVARGSSDAAQRAYQAAMADPKVIARRQKNLAKLTDEELNRAMELKGASAYSAGTAAATDKWERNITPYIQEIDRIVATLPERTRDVNQNVDRRLKPLATGLRAKKDALG